MEGPGRVEILVSSLASSSTASISKHTTPTHDVQPYSRKSVVGAISTLLALFMGTTNGVGGVSLIVR